MSNKKTKKPSPLGQGLASLLGDQPAQPVAVSAPTPNKPSEAAVQNLKTKLNNNQSSKIDQPQVTTESNAPIGDGVNIYLAIDQLKPGKFQPRRNFPPKELEELAQSIRAQGVLQPIIVRNVSTTPSQPDYEIVAGERRWRAAQQAALHEVPVVVRVFDDQTTLQLSILENVQRQDLSPIEEAEGYARLMDEFGHRQEDLAELFGKSRSHVANTVRLLAMPKKIRDALETSKITPGHARALMMAKDPEALLEDVIAMKMSVRLVEQLAKRMDSDGQVKTKKTAAEKDVDTLALEKSLEERLGLKVEINGKGERGTLTIKYKTLEQLDQILGRLR